ncbi:MerR family transcriptional regulator [Anaerocolumna chitinilytica]|uniref:MerR family transcriptional regulator n=1 Tax=Anaerocolumna chitinilytica TaxID=1727145 RepID=A0A7I8DPC2_9FIRM|nr:MerR family transcriptional regulator [Anaerocolumna chitinilytica]BCJ99577.1 MerR family transcriptional regulator [Anaerocolumna chitinilytica]
MIYTIKDVSKISGLSIFTIRFYDKVGLLPFVLKNNSGIRVFTESDVNLIQMICCLKNTGMKIKDIKKYIDMCMEGTDTIDSRKKMLLEHRREILANIDALNDNLKLIDSKIESYDSRNAAQIVNAQLKKLNDEKYENGLL